MTEKEKIEKQIILYELQLKELRSLPIKARPVSYNEQLSKIASHIRGLRSRLGAFLN